MKRFLSTIAFLFLSPVVVYALGLGDVVVNSALNQPLDGKIELLSPSPDDLDSLKIGLADSNAFAKAGIDRPFSLSKLKFNLRRSVDDGDDYISISTQAAIQEPFLNFLIEATWANGRILREYTILLDPPSYDFRTRMENTVNTEEVAVSTIQDSTTEYTSEQSKTPSQITNYVGGNYGPTVRADTLSEIAYKTRPDKSISLDQMMMAIYRANPEAFINQNINGLKGGYVLDIPDEAAIYELTAAEARRKVRSQHAAWGDVIFEEGAVSNEQTQLVNEIDVDKQKNEVTNEIEQADPELRLVVADDGAQATQETGESGPTKSNDLLVAEETIETLTQENIELKARLKELETLVAQLQPLLNLKDDELAAYQTQLAAKADTSTIQEDGEVEAASPDILNEPVTDETTVKDTTETELDPFEEEVVAETELDPFEEEVVAETEAAEEISESSAKDEEYTESVKRDAALVQEVLSPFESIISKVKNILMSKFGLALLAILLLLLVLLRFRKEPAETVVIEPIDDDELAEINKEVTGLMDDAAATQSSEDAIGSEDETIIAVQEAQLTDDEPSEQEQSAEFSIDEVNTYIAFEQYDEAEKSVRRGIQNDPNNEELHLKLLEVFYNSGNEGEYEKTARVVNDKFGNSGETWDKTVTMWKEMTDSPLSIADDGSEDETIVVGTPDDGSEDETIVVGTPDDGSEDETIVVGTPDDGSEDETVIADSATDNEASIDLEVPATEEDEGIEIDIGQQETDNEASIDLEVPATEEDEGIEIDIGQQDDDFEIDLSVPEDDKVDNDEIVAEEEASNELEKTEFNLSIDDINTDADDEIADTGDIEKEDDIGEIEFEISEDDEESEPNEKNQEDSHAAFVEQVAESEDLTTEDVVATKLDLAKAYVEVSDNENAKIILEEVLAEGDEDQRKQAQTLLDQI